MFDASTGNFDTTLLCMPSLGTLSCLYRTYEGFPASKLEYRNGLEAMRDFLVLGYENIYIFGHLVHISATDSGGFLDAARLSVFLSNIQMFKHIGLVDGHKQIAAA